MYMHAVVVSYSFMKCLFINCHGLFSSCSTPHLFMIFFNDLSEYNFVILL